MSKEPRRVTFTTISQPGSSSAPSVIAGNENSSSFSPSISRFGGGEFLTPNIPGSATGKGGTNKNINKTVRLQLELFATDTCKYPEFNYSKLLYLEKKKEKKMKQVSATTNGFGCDPFAENDEDVARIAKELEAKYGTTYVTGRGRSKKKDIGLGYDETDSFIDNTDAYDEVIPEEVETIEGGFYINCGALEFSNLNKKSNTSRTDEIIKMPDRPKKRALSTSSEESSSSESDDDDDDDDDDEEDEEAEADDDSETENDVDIDDENTSNKNDSDKLSTTKKKSYKHEDKRLKPDDSFSSKSKSLNVSKNGSKKQNKKTKFLTSGSSSNSPRPNAMETNSDTDDRQKSQKVVVKTTTVKDMLKAKRDNFLKSQEAIGGGSVKSINGEVKCTSSEGDSDSDSSATETETEQEILLETKSKKPENTENLRTSDTKLPTSLDPDVIANINNFKELTKSKNLMGKKFFFDQKLTELLLKIDEALLCIDKNERNMVFAHMEFQLQLPKYFFLRKAKQLRIKEEKAKTGRALEKLSKAVEAHMRTCITSYETELRKFAVMQANNINSEHPPKMPRKKFPWNSDIRNLLYEVYHHRWTSFAVLGTRKETLQGFISDYLKNKVVEIWPSGWMRVEELQKEIEKRKNATKRVRAKATRKELKTAATITTPTSNNAIITQGNDVVQTVSTTAPSNSSGNSAYLKKNEEYPTTSTGRSYANSDTDSVASISSNERVKQTKNKSMRNQQQIQPLASTSGVAAALTMPIVSTSGALDLVSSARKTDHSIYNIMSAMAAVPSTSASVTSVASKQSNTHSNTIARPPAHVINLDDYKCPSDILQTSKQLASALLTTGKESDIPINFANNLNTSGRIESGSESDSVEIVGVFPANHEKSRTPTNMNSGPSLKQKYNKKNLADSTVKQFSNSSPGPTNLAIERLIPMNNNNNGTGNGNITFSAKDLERIKQIRQQQFLGLSQSKLKGSPTNE